MAENAWYGEANVVHGYGFSGQSLTRSEANSFSNGLLKDFILGSMQPGMFRRFSRPRLWANHLRRSSFPTS